MMRLRSIWIRSRGCFFFFLFLFFVLYGISWDGMGWVGWADGAK